MCLKCCFLSFEENMNYTRLGTRLSGKYMDWRYIKYEAT
jgi:hypothetical protein